jgi:hypothetical protein
MNLMTQRQLYRRLLTGIGILILTVASMGPIRAQNAATATPRSAAQLEQLVAPIALYPDALLSQVLMASTYPLEVVAAARWSQANPNVAGDALQTAMEKQTWDPSVKALTAIPQTLQMMNDKLDWTQQLGDAFLAQQGDVLDAVQRLRARADANGQLKSTPQQTVTSMPRPAAQGAAPATPASVPANVYTIEPTNPDEYYVPIYDPGVVYGDWPYSDYQPFYWYPPGWTGTGYGFGAGVLAGAAIWGGVNWLGNRVQINPLRYNNFNRTNIANGNWTHNPAHRGGVPYRDAGVAQRFGNQGNAAAREAFRGKADAGRRDLATNPGANRPGANRPGGNTPGANRPSQNGPGNAKAAAAKNKAANNNTGRTGAGNKAAGGKANTAKNAAANRPNKGTSKAAANKNNRPAANRQAQARPAARPTAGRSSMAQTRSPGGGARAGGGARGGGARGGGGRRSDLRLKHGISLLGYLDNGIGFYRFSYNGSSKAYVGVIAQEVMDIMPQAVARGRDGYLRVFYDRLGVTFQTYKHWIGSGARIPSGAAG